LLRPLAQLATLVQQAAGFDDALQTGLALAMRSSPPVGFSGDSKISNMPLYWKNCKRIKEGYGRGRRKSPLADGHSGNTIGGVGVIE
jgi:hypothetical protein